MGRKSFTEEVIPPSLEETVSDPLPPATLAEQAAGRDALAKVYANRVMPTEEFEAPKE